MKQKTFLTFEEKVKAAYLHFYMGIDQHMIAQIAFDGINQGRVNEACKAVERALKENEADEPRQVKHEHQDQQGRQI